jgi:hypothetical protein
MSKQKDRDDPIADYIEWTNNRYNPGYYLGGNIPPYLRKSRLGRRGRLLVGASLVLSAVIGLGDIIAAWPWADGFSRLEIVMTSLIVVLIASAGVVMIRASRRGAKQHGTIRAGKGKRHG